MRLSQYLTEQNASFEAMMHPPAFTAQKRARFLRVPGRQVIKCVLLASGTRFLLAILRSTDHVDIPALEKFMGAPVRLATEADLAEQFCECEPGAVTPFGSLYGVRTLLEDSIQPEHVILFEAEQHAMAIRMKCRDFEALEKPTRWRFGLNKSGTSTTPHPSRER